MSKRKPTFMDLCLSGKASADDLPEFVQAWHEGKGDQPLHDFLGMTEVDYTRTNHSDAAVDAIVEAKRAARARPGRGKLVRIRKTAKAPRLPASLASMHVVVFRKGKAVHSAEFDSHEAAQAFVRSLLDDEVKSDDIGYFRLTPSRAEMAVAI